MCWNICSAHSPVKSQFLNFWQNVFGVILKTFLCVWNLDWHATKGNGWKEKWKRGSENTREKRRNNVHKWCSHVHSCARTHMWTETHILFLFSLSHAHTCSLAHAQTHTISFAFTLMCNTNTEAPRTTRPTTTAPTTTTASTAMAAAAAATTKHCRHHHQRQQNKQHQQQPTNQQTNQPTTRNQQQQQL